MFLNLRKKRKCVSPEKQKDTKDNIGYNIDGICGGKVNVIEYATPSLAFLGDAVYSLMAREFLIKKTKCPANKLHKLSLNLVSASAQANAALALMPFLSQDEIAIYKRGRNTQIAHKPKNQTDADYHSATGLEVLFGHLYLTYQNERLKELFNIIAGELCE